MTHKYMAPIRSHKKLIASCSRITFTKRIITMNHQMHKVINLYNIIDPIITLSMRTINVQSINPLIGIRPNISGIKLQRSKNL